jgi:hypothetical protein
MDDASEPAPASSQPAQPPAPPAAAVAAPAESDEELARRLQAEFDRDVEAAQQAAAAARRPARVPSIASLAFALFDQRHVMGRGGGYGRRGATAGAIDALPSFPCRGGKYENEECRICMTRFERDVLLRPLPCLHTYHTECIDRWLAQAGTCPICNRRVDEGVE